MEEKPQQSTSFLSPEFESKTAGTSSITDQINPGLNSATTSSDPGNEPSKKKRKCQNLELENIVRPKSAAVIFEELNLKPEYDIKQVVEDPKLPRWYTVSLMVNDRLYLGEGTYEAAAKKMAADEALKDWLVRSLHNCETAEEVPAIWSTINSYGLYLLLSHWQLDTSEVKHLASIVGDETFSVSSVGCSTQTKELRNYSVTSPKFPPDAEKYEPLYIFNKAFPNVPFVEDVNESNLEAERFQLQCKINDCVYEAKASSRKSAQRKIAIQVLKKFGLQFPAIVRTIGTIKIIKTGPKMASCSTNDEKAVEGELPK